MSRKDRFHRRGQAALPWLVVGVVALGVLGLLLSRFSTSDEATPPAPSTYLGDEQGVIARRRAARQEASDEAAARVREAREATRRRMSARSNRSTAAFTRLFQVGKPTARYDQGERSDMAELLSSPDVLYRMLGLDSGDFVYHRTRGWLQFVDGRWVAVEPRDFPREVAAAYPQLVPRPGSSGPPVDPEAVGGDGRFAIPGWMATEEEEG